MAESVLRNQRIWLNGRALQTQANAVALSIAADELDRTSLADSFKVRRGGLKSGVVSCEGFFDADLDAGLDQAFGVAGQIVTIGAPDVGEGALAYGLKAFAGDYSPWGGKIGDLAGFSLGAVSDGELVRGAIAADRTVSANGTGVGIQLPAPAAPLRLFAGLHILSMSAGATLDVEVKSAPTNAFAGGGTTRIDFGVVNAAAAPFAAWSSFAAGTTETWFRAAFTLTGTTPQAVVALFLGVA
ncbi:hypothetical protein ACN2C7_10950 [Caulobacter sp. ErkDOM-E]|uniref:hypothetical protein n=1 Tax=Caulobacter sp. ErkDOM-E TaxID=3402778 RepID=UPI003AF5D1D0